MSQPEKKRRARPPLFSQRGVAMIAASVAISIIAVIVYEFESNTNIDYAAAANARDDMRAHFLARSGMNLSRLVIKVQTSVLDKYRNQLGDIQLADYLPLFMGAFGGGKEEVAAMAEAMGGVNTDSMKGLGLPAGEFDIQVTTEDGKLNLNCAKGTTATQQLVESVLTAMFLPVAYDPLFQNPDAEGWRRDRAQQIYAIMDFIDPGDSRRDTPGAPEDYGYEGLRDRYLPKNNYLDTIDEAKLVRGVDDRFWTLFGPAFTVYGGCRVNLGALADVNLVAALIAVSAKDPDDQVLREPRLLWALAHRVVQARSVGILFDTPQQFADFVKDPDAALGELLGLAGEGGGAPPPPTGPPIVGVELDPAKLAQVARTGPRRTYRVEATSSIGRVRKRIVGVWDTQPQPQNRRDPTQRDTGAWVFWREE